MAATAPDTAVGAGGIKARFPRRFRFRWPVNGRMTAALAFSLFFHLSMITIFRIVIVLPREQVVYYDVSIVSTSGEGAAQMQKTGDTLALAGPSLYDSLPEVELPVVEFAELERLRIRYDAAEPGRGVDDLFQEFTPTDSWARFGGELQRFGKTLRELALPGQEQAPGPAATPEKKRILEHRPAQGFTAYVEWSGPPEDRELLFSPPIKALWEVNPAELARPIEIVFKVDPSGRVVNVWSPILDDSGMIDEVQMTVLQYRFAPLVSSGTEGGSAPAEQSGVLIISAAEEAS